MSKKNKIFTYHYFSDPIKDEYIFGDDRKSLIEFIINECKLRLYEDDSGFIEMLRIDIKNPDRNPDFIAHYLKQYVQSVLRLCYVIDFKFSRVITKMTGEFNDENDKPKVNTGTIDLTKNKSKPIFNDKTFLNMLQLFSNKPSQLDLLSAKIDYIDNPINCYSDLYKIIEFEFHLSEDRRETKRILKNSRLKNIVNKFQYKGKTGDDLIDLIVDLRHKCNHLKNTKYGSKFGFSPSNIDDVKEVQEIIPIMRKISAQVIDPGFEILN